MATKQTKARLAATREKAKRLTPKGQKQADAVSNAMVYAGAMTKAMRKDGKQ